MNRRTTHLCILIAGLSQIRDVVSPVFAPSKKEIESITSFSNWAESTARLERWLAQTCTVVAAFGMPAGAPRFDGTTLQVRQAR